MPHAERCVAEVRVCLREILRFRESLTLIWLKATAAKPGARAVGSARAIALIPSIAPVLDLAAAARKLSWQAAGSGVFLGLSQIKVR